MKNIQLTKEQALELYKTNPEYRDTLLSVFTDEELNIKPVLRDWEDLDFNNSFYPDHIGRTFKQNVRLNNAGCLNVPSEKHAKSMIAFAKLSMLMNDLGNECRVDWNDQNQIKHVIERIENDVILSPRKTEWCFLAFKTLRTRDYFVEKHYQLIKEYFML